MMTMQSLVCHTVYLTIFENQSTTPVHVPSSSSSNHQMMMMMRARVKRTRCYSSLSFAAIWYCYCCCCCCCLGGPSFISSVKAFSPSTKNTNPHDALAAVVVQVQVEQILSGVSPHQAKEAWLSYHWNQGGGLAVLVTHDHDDDDDDDDHHTSRRLFPIGIQERLLDDMDDNKNKNNNQDDGDLVDTTLTIRYQVTDMGLLLSSELTNHSSQVYFVENTTTGENTTTNMIWKVEFEVIHPHRAKVWKAITQLMIQMMASNLEAYTQVPRLYQRTTRLRPRPLHSNNNNNNNNKKKEHLSQQWIDFVWKHGGGLLLPLLPPPWQLNNTTRIMIPPFLAEQLVSVQDDEIQYTVLNPGLFTYQVHSHLGRVRFHPAVLSKDNDDNDDDDDDDVVEMVWEVQIRPWRGFLFDGWSSIVVESFTAAIITILARNFQCHIQEPGVMVKVAPPRGGGQGGLYFGQVRKDSWLGGVLAAHLKDSRSTIEQTIAMVQPWTWGRSTDEKGEGGTWTTGYM